MRFSTVVAHVFLCCSVATACKVTQPSGLPLDARWLVVVKSAPLDSSWSMSFAHHAYVDIVRDGRPERIESGGRIGILHGEMHPEELRVNRRFGERAVRVLGCTASKTGVRRDTPLPGAAVGLREDHEAKASQRVAG